VAFLDDLAILTLAHEHARGTAAADVEERAPVELHVGEVLEQHVDGLDVATLELLPGQRSPMHSREVVELLTDDDAEVLETHR
jgi:hypothetical protein